MQDAMQLPWGDGSDRGEQQQRNVIIAGLVRWGKYDTKCHYGMDGEAEAIHSFLQTL